MTMAMTFPMIGPLLLLPVCYYISGFPLPIIFIASPFAWFLWFMPLVWLFNWKRFFSNVKQKVDSEMFYEDKQIKPEKLVLFTKTLGYYFVNGILPIKNTFYHSFLQSCAGAGKDKAYTMKCRWFWIGVAVLAMIGFYWTCRPWDISSFALLWWAFAIAPFCNAFRVHQEISERYMYLPNVGFMFFLATILMPYPWLAAFFVGGYVFKMWFYMDAYQDDFYLTEWASLASPDAWFGWHVKAMKRLDAKSHQEALIYWTMAKRISPTEFKVNVNLATILTMSADPAHRAEGKKLLAVAEANIPRGQEVQAGKILDEWKKGNMAVLL
jgi:hypothetical protein